MSAVPQMPPEIHTSFGVAKGEERGIQVREARVVGSRRGEEGAGASLESLTSRRCLERQNRALFAPQLLFLLHSAAAVHLIASG